MKATILYIMDPLCGWCYGFSPVVKRVQEEHPDFNYHVITGGMITGDRVQPVAAMSGYILNAYKRVEDLSGVKVGEPYLDMLREGTEMNNSEPPCRAIHAFQEMRSNMGLKFAHEVQKKLFVQGKSLNDESTYAELAQEFDIDTDEFLKKMKSEENGYATVQDWQWCKAAGITGFPCLVMQLEDKYYMLAQGFTKYEDVKAVLDKVVSL